jgi:hypothetical protein
VRGSGRLLTNDSIAAVRTYSGPAHEGINQALRAGGQLDADARKIVDAIDDAMRRSTLQSDVISYRTVSGPDIFGSLPADLTGRTWTDAGFVSTTVERSGADAIVAARRPIEPVILRIKAPKGTGGVEVSAIQHGEGELLLGRGLSFRVTADHGITENGARLLDVEIVTMRERLTPRQIIGLTPDELPVAYRARQITKRQALDQLAVNERGNQLTVTVMGRGPEVQRAQANLEHYAKLRADIEAIPARAPASGPGIAVQARTVTPRTPGAPRTPKTPSGKLTASQVTRLNPDELLPTFIDGRITQKQALDQLATFEKFSKDTISIMGYGGQNLPEVIRAREALARYAAIRTEIEQRVLREAARARNALVESGRGTANLLAEVDELISKGAAKATIRQRLDDALIQPGQVFAGADPATLKALREALASGDAAKLRSALTRAGTKAKLKPISKAGAKVKFDPATMEPFAGDIADGAQVIVVRRGSTLTLPDGKVLQLTKAKVTAVAKPVKATRVKIVLPARFASTRAISGEERTWWDSQATTRVIARGPARRNWDEAIAFLRHGSPDLALGRLAEVRAAQIFANKSTDLVDALIARIQATA